MEGLSFPDANFLGLVSSARQPGRHQGRCGAGSGDGVGELQGPRRLQGWEAKWAPEARWSSLQGPLSPHSPPRFLPGVPLFTDTAAFRGPLDHDPQHPAPWRCMCAGEASPLLQLHRL